MDAKLVREARDLEMNIFKDMGVCVRVPRSEQRKCNGQIITTRGIDTNKGDVTKPKYRSRLVGKEFRTHADDALYASSSLLEALRLISAERPRRTRQDTSSFTMPVGRTSTLRLPEISLSNYENNMKHMAKEISWVS